MDKFSLHMGVINMRWHQKDAKAVVDELNTDAKDGLSSRQANEKLAVYGRNTLREKKKTPMIVKFFLQFNDFMIIILFAAAGISFFTSVLHGHADYADPIIILLIVVLNAVLGLAQESKAQKSLDALKSLSKPTCKVIRGGAHLVIPAEELVPGDLVRLEAGDIVPADCRLIEAHNLKAEESALTGESVPVEKDEHVVAADEPPVGDRRNMLFFGSSVVYGRGLAVVVETGMKTEVGKIAEMIQGDTPETPLQKKLAQTGKMLGIGALAICVVIFLLGVMRKIPPFDMFMTSVSLAVAAIPEGLPAIVTIMLAIGVQRMAKCNAVIRKLPAVETLGSASVICSDKTGTLTMNKMKVVDYSCDNKVEMMKCMLLCNDCIIEEDRHKKMVIGDPTETALVNAAFEMGMDKPDADAEFPRAAEIPFDSKRKLMTTIHKSGGKYLQITKGAPEFLIDKCGYYLECGTKQKMTADKRRAILEDNAAMAGKALRVIAVSVSEHKNLPVEVTPERCETDLTYIGLCGMIDPPREEAAAAVLICQNAGIKPVMVTGDHKDTASAIAREIGIMRHGDLALSGDSLNRMTDAELEARVMDYSVFARVSPEHKMRIVKAFQKNGHIVAMTGDGVNDAPALKAADIGCAMGIAGTDVAKEAAAMVLTNDDFATIVKAVKEGRGIYANIRKAVHFLLSSNIGEILTILTAIVMGWESPLLAIQLLWVNLVTDSLPAIALGVDRAPAEIMTEKPEKHQSLFDGGLWQRIGLEGGMIGLLSIIAFAVGKLFFTGGLTTGRTMAFATLSISQLVHAFNVRSKKTVFRAESFENRYLIGAFFIGLILQVSVIMLPSAAALFKVIPLSTSEWSVVALLSLMPVFIVELEKRFMWREKPVKAGHPYLISATD